MCGQRNGTARRCGRAAGKGAAGRREAPGQGEAVAAWLALGGAECRNEWFEYVGNKDGGRRDDSRSSTFMAVESCGDAGGVAVGIEARPWVFGRGKTIRAGETGLAGV